MTLLSNSIYCINSFKFVKISFMTKYMVSQVNDLYVLEKTTRSAAVVGEFCERQLDASGRWCCSITNGDCSNQQFHDLVDFLCTTSVNN